jgi:hypothetical protein
MECGHGRLSSSGHLLPQFSFDRNKLTVPLKGPYRVRKLASPELVLEEGDRMMVMAEAKTLRRLSGQGEE